MIKSVSILTISVATVVMAACARFDVPDSTDIIGASHIEHADCPTWQVLPKASSTRLPNEFSVLSWNVYKGYRDGWHDSLDQFIEFSDIALLQEAMTPNLTDFWQPRGWSSQMVHAFSDDGQSAGVLSASRVSPMAVCGQREDEPLLQLPKSLLAVQYPIAVDPQQTTFLLVVNLHSINFTWDTSAYQQQLDSIEVLVKGHAGPVIIAGDFNTWNEERQRLVKGWAGSLLLQEVGFDVDARVTFRGHALDHIYYRGLTVLTSQATAVNTSDHNPLRVRFKLS